MLSQPPDQRDQIAQLHATVARLQDTVQELEAQRQSILRRRRRQLLMVGAMISLAVHITFMMYLAQVYRWEPGGGGPEPVAFEFAIEQDDELTELEETELSDLIEEDPSEIVEPTDPVIDLAVQPPAAELEITDGGALPALGGSGGDPDQTAISGGGAGRTSFFGIVSKGRRFAYIVDRSGSMGELGKMDVAKRELAESVESLPDYAYFYVVLFSSNYAEPPMQKGWTQARTPKVRRLISWLDDVAPSGGTQPKTAFVQVFSLDVRPDVIYFLTDGQIGGFTADEVAQMNSQGKRVVINTIAFGDPASQDLLKKIADQSGGVYRYVPSSGY